MISAKVEQVEKLSRSAEQSAFLTGEVLNVAEFTFSFHFFLKILIFQRKT
jgi:hypothetical protein